MKKSDETHRKAQNFAKSRGTQWLLYGAIQFQILYAIPALATTLESRKHRDALKKLQWRSLLHVISGYRTMCAKAALVIAGIPSISLSEEQRRLFFYKGGKLTWPKSYERNLTIRRWQATWESLETTVGSIRILIGSINPWVMCHFRRVDYYAILFLSGHGAFRSYRKRFKLAENCLWPDCTIVEAFEYVIFECKRWTTRRTILEEQPQCEIAAHNIIKVMLESEANCNRMRSHIRNVTIAREVYDKNK